MSRTYELKDFRKGSVGVVVIYENRYKFSFVLETRISGDYISLSGNGFKREEDALLFAFKQLESRSNEGLQHEKVRCGSVFQGDKVKLG